MMETYECPKCKQLSWVEPCNCCETITDPVNRPAHYGGKDNTYKAIKVIEAWKLGFCLGNAVKYISRAGKKNHEKTIEDLQKAAWYINREIERLVQK